MPVRNITSIGRTKPIPVYVWIPPTFGATHKIEIVSGSDTYDVTDITLDAEFIDGVTETIGDFTVKIDNSTQIYTNTFSPYDQIKLYANYGASATTERFVGRIERISKSDHNLVLTGKSLAIKYMGKNVTYSASSTARSTILSAIISQYSSEFVGLTTNNLESDTGTMTVNYADKPFMDVIEEICKDGSRDSYIDVDSDFHYFASGSRYNNTEAVVHELNLIATGDFSPDTSNIFNKVKVYGATDGNIPILATAGDTASQTIYGVKELKIDDASITTQVQAQARADYELSINKDPITLGEIISLGLPTIQPGEQVRISDPLNGLTPSFYQIHKYTHKFSNDEPFQTTLTVQKERSTIPRILKERIKFESEITATNNPNELNFSYITDLGIDSGTHTNTVISVNSSTGKGELKTDGSATGTWVSDTINLASNITAIEPRIGGTNLSSVLIAISTNGGRLFTSISSGTTTIPAGKNLQIKLTFASATTVVTTVGFLYSL